ncbi:MAG: RNA pseudouridine synthase, partial [Oscillospiraceae bacterium]
KIGFIHPKTGEYMEFLSELPPYYQKILKYLRNL